jgi:hypothetical protein
VSTPQLNYRYELTHFPVPDDQPATLQLIVHSLQQEGWAMPLTLTWNDLARLYQFLDDQFKKRDAQEAYVALNP